MMDKSPLRLGWVVSIVLWTMSTPAAAVESLETAMKEIATSLSPSLSESGLKKLAVVEFTDLNGYRSALGPFLAEELTTQLIVARPGAFDFVERQQLVKVLEEQKLTSSSLFEAGSIASVGKVLGIQAIVTGSMADLGDEIKINTRVISVESARIVAAASAKFPRKGSAETLLRQTGGSGYPGGSLGSKPTQASDVYFSNELVQVTVDSISLKSDGKGINLALVIQNLTNEDLILSLRHNDAKLSSSTGDAYYSNYVSGFEHDSFHSWTTFSARSRTVIAISFEARQPPPPGHYSLSAVMSRLVEKEPAPFSVGITGIRLQLNPTTPIRDR